MNGRWWVLAGLMFATCRPPAPSALTEARADEPVAVGAKNGFAVVELFTSEGCSSCPPADALLADLVKANRSVYALEFHVDYWDDLGWRDRFGSTAYTARQQAYARALGGRGLYTPQMIVNGLESFTGSDRTHAEQSIARAVARPAPVSLSIEVRKASSDAISVEYDVANAPADSAIDIAVVEDATSSDVRSGENAGRVLHHTNVVRAFVVAPLRKPEASIVVRVPATLWGRDGEVIAYVQRPSGEGGMPVLGATRAAVPR